jgi:hypothetical protein
MRGGQRMRGIRLRVIDAALAQLAEAASQPAADIQGWCDHLLETMTGGSPLADDVAILCVGLGTG